jgi:hypothetical protein
MISCSGGNAPVETGGGTGFVQVGGRLLLGMILVFRRRTKSPDSHQDETRDVDLDQTCGAISSDHRPIY